MEIQFFTINPKKYTKFSPLPKAVNQFSNLFIGFFHFISLFSLKLLNNNFENNENNSTIERVIGTSI